MTRSHVLALAAVLVALPACTIYLGDDDDDPPWPPYPDAGYWPPDAGYPPPDAPAPFPDAARPDAPSPGADAGCAPDAGPDTGGGPGRYDFAFIVDDLGGPSVALGSTDGRMARLAGPFTALQHLAVSPTGAHIAFGSYEDGWKLRVLDIATGATRLVGSGDLEGAPSWSPDGSQLAYEWRRSGSDLAPSVVRASLDGRTFEIVAEGAVGTWDCLRPAWSPDGRELAFGSPGGVRVRTVATGVTRSVTTTRDACQPAWSPDGRALAFTHGAPEAGNLALVGARGGPVRSLAALYNTPALVAMAWEPSAASLVYVDYDPALGTFALRQVRIADGAATSVVDADGYISPPAWSPDGATVLFGRYVGGSVLALWGAHTGEVTTIGAPAQAYGPRAAHWLPAPVVRP
jgi:hypothetical protein